MIKAMIFDMDGVLIDSMSAHFKAWTEILSPYHKLTTKEFEGYAGRGIGDIFSELQEKYSIPYSVDQWRKMKHKIYLGLQDEINLFPNVLETLDDIKTRGLKMAVGTSETMRITENILIRLEIRKYFKAIVGSDQVKKAKPDPEIFLKSAEALGVEPENAVVIEDAPSGVEAAKRAKMKCIAITNTVEKEELSKADFIINDIKQILDITKE